MLKVGLTGGIAAGKSVVGEMFAGLGAHVIQADHIGHQLMQPGEAVYQEVIEHFGAGILNPDGTVNRSRLAEAAFGRGNSTGSSTTSSRIDELNKIVHPAVLKRQAEWMEEIGRSEPAAIAIVEAALILEAGAAHQFDRLVVVACRPEQRIERWARKLQVDNETAQREVARRMAAQLSDEEKIKMADYVIDNSGALGATTAQVRSVFTKLQTEARAQTPS